MALPIELFLKTLSYLVPSDLASIARCSRAHCDVALPLLYQRLSLRLHSGDPDAATMVLLRTLAANAELRYFIRQVDVSNESSTFWTAGHSKLLSVVLSGIITHPDRVKSFSWKAGLLQTNIFFPRIEQLECTKLVNTTDLLWVKWHLFNCQSLRSISLCLSRRISGQAGQWFLSDLSLPQLRELSLQGADLSPTNIGLFKSLHTLELKLCQGLSICLSRLVLSGIPPPLKSLKLAGNIDLESLEFFLTAVASTVQLEELSLRIGGVTSLVSYQLIQALGPRLSTLVLDFRRELSDPRSSLRYGFEKFQIIVSDFPLLKMIGLALDLKNPKFIRYQRSKFAASSHAIVLYDVGRTNRNVQKDGVAEKSNLECIHLRGHCVPLKRYILDAKHLAGTFAHRGPFSVFLDHGSRLRKLNFAHKSFESVFASEAERMSLSTDLYGIYG